MQSDSSSQNIQQLAVAIGQKLMLDIRYFDPKQANDQQNRNQLVGYQGVNQQSHVAVTSLPASVAALITELNLGGTILFAENLVDAQQIQQLTRQIQHCSSRSSSQLPAFISVDQEGGRVVRLPKDKWPAFAGNMAIAAAPNSSDYAFNVGTAIGKQLAELGINVNHSPTVDVNINHQNPVINVRAFGDNADVVASLGIAMAKGLQGAGTLATFKHFPGHGDTQVDSHTGLPRVEHTIDMINEVDLWPFNRAITNGCAQMIMTAHIQFPALDNSVMPTKTGEYIMRPATLSRRIINDLLREKMNYQGLVITDALDMHSISEFFSPATAIIETFKAGVDIALMPFKIHGPVGINQFRGLFEQLVRDIAADSALTSEVLSSFERIKRVKGQLLTKPIAQVNIKQHRALESKLAFDSLVTLKHSFRNLTQSLIIAMPQLEQARALSLAITAVSSNYQIQVMDLTQLAEFVVDGQCSLILGIEDKPSVVTLGGADDLASFNEGDVNFERLITQLDSVNKSQAKSIFVSLKAPYNTEPFVKAATDAYACLDGHWYIDDDEAVRGAAFTALARVLIGDEKPPGQLPITI